MVLNVIDIDLAGFILHHRCKDGKENVRDPVNIRSCASCISEVIRIKDSHLFLVKLNAAVNIVVKIKNLNQWHEKLELYKEFIFTCVRPTTLQKGSKNAHRVYAATEQSELIIPGDLSFVEVNYIDWLNQHGCDSTEHLAGLKQEDILCRDLFSYQGKITNVLDGNMCVYELDDTVRLYASKVPAVHKFSHLQIGSTVIVQNAHHRVSQEFPKLSIYCCMLSSIKVINTGNEKKCITKKASDTLKRLLFLSDQTQLQLDQIFDVRQILKKQFLAQYGERQMEKTFSVIIQSKEISDIVCKVTPRNVLDEFLSVPHQCLLQDSAMIQDNRQLVTIGDVKNNIPGINKDCLEWQSMKVPGDSTHVIIGVLEANEQNGEIFIKDSTGNLGVLISSCHGNNEVTAKCSASCDCSNQLPGEMFPCSYLHPCCKGKTVAISVYLLISETLFKERRLLFKKLNKQNSTCDDICDRYVVFDMKDAIFISHFKLVSNTVLAEATDKVSSVGCSKQDLPRNDSRHKADSNTIENSMQNQIPYKQNITTDDQSSNKISTLHKHVREDGGIFFCKKTTCSIQSRILLSDTTSSMPENSVPSSVGKSSKNDDIVQKATFQVKPIPTKKRSHVDSKSVDEQNKVSRTEIFEVPRLDILAGNLNGFGSVKFETKTNGVENGNQTKDYDEVLLFIENKGSLIAGEVECRFNAECVLIDRDTNKKVILEFTRRASRWYHMLYPQSVYKLSVYGTAVSVLSQCFSGEKVQKMLMKSNTKICYRVHSEVNVSQVWASNSVVTNSVVTDLDILHEIEDVLDTSNTEKFVSFEGIIIGRHLVKPGFGPRYNIEDKGASGMFSRLHVQDKNKKNDIWVYLNDDSIISYRGLIPGASVRFNGLERKVSKFSNVYCRLTAVSSVNVLALSMERSEKFQLKDDQSPVVCLSELWTLKSSRGQVFQCVCDVEKILKVSFKCLCEKCGSQIQHGTCSNKSCDSGLGHRFLARASAIFDDGTCIAMVTLTGCSVQYMLQLSDDQWRCLEDEVRMSGELFVQQCNPAVYTDMENFIYFLCDNHSVKKTWLLMFRTKCALDIDSINFDEFSVKNFETGTSRISTKCLPFLQLECVQLSTFDPVCWSMKHILHT